MRTEAQASRRVMKRLLTGIFLGLVSSAAAWGADLEVSPLARGPIYGPAYGWTGFYAGVNVGGGWSKGTKASDLTFDQGTPLDNGAAFQSTGNQKGWAAGGQFGYNHQFGMLVVGFEADLQATGIGPRKNQNLTDAGATFGIATAAGLPAAPATFPHGNIAFFNTGDANPDRMNWFSTVRARAGIALDRLLIYGTGGVAFSDSPSALDSRVSSGGQLPFAFYNNNLPAGLRGINVSATGSLSRWRDYVGAAAGGGVEFAVTDYLTVKTEALLLHFGGQGCCNAGDVVGVTSTGFAVVSAGNGSRVIDYVIARAGVNYKFKSY